MHSTTLLEALEEAQKGRGFCAPNPAVGAVVLNKSGDLLAKGYHHRFGEPHAEVEVLGSLSESETEGGTLYVTLEPCCHQGKTPPCVDLILQKKIARVIYGFNDPNPLVAGKGASYLREHGVACERHALPEIKAFYQAYRHWLEKKRPWVTAKLAFSLDGKIAGPAGEPTSITGAEANRLTHQLRKKSDGILTTVKTVITDNPQLNARLNGKQFNKRIFILDSALRFPLSAKINKTSASITLFYDKQQPSERIKPQRIKSLGQAGIQCVPVSLKQGLLSLDEVLDYIAEKGVYDLWVEAGGTLTQQLIKEKFLNQMIFYIAPKTLGSQAQSAFCDILNFSKAQDINWQSLGDDVMCEITL